MARLKGISIKEWVDKVTINPVATAIGVFFLAVILVVLVTLSFNWYDNGFWKNVIVEAHGMLFDILILGIFVVWLNEKGKKKLKIQRCRDEIDDFRHGRSEEATFRIAGNIRRLNKLKVTNIDLIFCYLNNAQLKEANLRGADLREANLERANLWKSDLGGADLRNADLGEANLEEAYLERANLREADLEEANLGDANLYGANLWNANLERANLREANLERANLWNANLGDADLGEANLEEAYLERANLRRANLERANLWNADLGDANLREANLERTKNLHLEKLSKVKTLYGVINLDLEPMEQIEKKYPHLLEKPKVKK